MTRQNKELSEPEVGDSGPTWQPPRQKEPSVSNKPGEGSPEEGPAMADSTQRSAPGVTPPALHEPLSTKHVIINLLIIN